MQVAEIEVSVEQQELVYGQQRARLTPKLAELARAVVARPDGVPFAELPGVTNNARTTCVTILRKVARKIGLDVERRDGVVKIIAGRSEHARKPDRHYPDPTQVVSKTLAFEPHVYRRVPNPTDEERARTIDLLRSGAVPISEALDALYPATRKSDG